MNFLQILPNVDKPIVSETRGIFYSVYEEFLVLGLSLTAEGILQATNWMMVCVWV